MKREQLITGEVYTAIYYDSSKKYIVLGNGKKGLMKYIDETNNIFGGSGDFSHPSWTFQPASQNETDWLLSCVAKGHMVKIETIPTKCETYSIF